MSDPLTRTGQFRALTVQADEHRQAISDGKARISERLRNWHEQQASRTARVLLVDDHELALVAMGRVLTPYVVDAVTDAREALRLVRSVEYDLVITDLDMPIMTGMDLVVELRRESMRPLVPVLVMSGEADALALADLARRCGATAWLQKPYDVARFQHDVAELVAL